MLNKIQSLFNYLILLSLSILVRISECTFYQINTTDGCPYTFDTGNYGIVYLKPSFCEKLLPDNRNLSETPEWGPSPFTLKLYYTDEVDSFRLEVTSKKKAPMLEVWVTTSRVNSKGKYGYPVGAFLPYYNYELYCCDWTKVKTVARYSSSADSRADNLLFHTAHIIWTPLTFTGRFVFVANILISERNWYGGVTSTIYTMPPFIPDFLHKDSAEMNKSLHYWNESLPGE